MSNILVLHRRIDAPVNHSPLGRRHSREQNRHTRPHLPLPLAAVALVLRSSSLQGLICRSVLCLNFLACYWLSPPSQNPTVHKRIGTGTSPYERASHIPCTLLPCLTSAPPTLPGVVEAKRSLEAALSPPPYRCPLPNHGSQPQSLGPTLVRPHHARSNPPTPRRFSIFFSPIRCCPQNLLTPPSAGGRQLSPFTPFLSDTLHLSVSLPLSLKLLHNGTTTPGRDTPSAHGCSCPSDERSTERVLHPTGWHRP